MMKACLLIGSILLICSVANATEDVIIPWHSATISFGSPVDKNLLHIAANEDNELSQLVVQWKGRDLVVPSSEFKMVRNVHLDTVKVLESGDPSYAYLNVSVYFGDYSVDHDPHYPVAWFLFFPGRYDHLMMVKPTSKTSEDYIEKFPGKEPQKEGTSTVIREAPSPTPK